VGIRGELNDDGEREEEIASGVVAEEEETVGPMVEGMRDVGELEAAGENNGESVDGANEGEFGTEGARVVGLSDDGDIGLKGDEGDPSAGALGVTEGPGAEELDVSRIGEREDGEPRTVEG
jgi:hypothetical protein